MVFLCGLYQSRLPGSCWRTAVWLLCDQPSPRRPSASGVCAAVLRWAAACVWLRPGFFLPFWALFLFLLIYLLIHWTRELTQIHPLSRSPATWQNQHSKSYLRVAAKCHRASTLLLNKYTLKNEQTNMQIVQVFIVAGMLAVGLVHFEEAY